MKVTPIKSDSLPRPRCSPSERADYDAACKLEGVNVNSNMRTIALNWIASVFKKHGSKARSIQTTPGRSVGGGKP